MDTPDDRREWSARFGWIVGGIVGLIAGFAVTYVIERRVFGARGEEAIHLASRAATLVVPGLFLAGALAGHAFGAKGGLRRYRALGVSAGVLIAVCGWALIVITRR